MSCWYAKLNFISIYIVNRGFLNDFFWMFLLSDLDECVIDIFKPLPVVISDVYKNFYDSVHD